MEHSSIECCKIDDLFKESLSRVLAFCRIRHFLFISFPVENKSVNNSHPYIWRVSPLLFSFGWVVGETPIEFMPTGPLPLRFWTFQLLNVFSIERIFLCLKHFFVLTRHFTKRLKIIFFFTVSSVFTGLKTFLDSAEVFQSLLSNFITK